jgi:hypothetical protein
VGEKRYSVIIIEREELYLMWNLVHQSKYLEDFEHEKVS